MDKSIIKLREKTLKSGAKSLYLDYYKDGIRTYEFLKLYIEPGNDSLTKARNKVTYTTARTIQSDRILAIQQGRANILTPEKRAIKFSSYFKEYIEELPERRRGYAKCAYLYWVDYAGENCTLSSIDIKKMCGFTKYLETRTSEFTGKPLASMTRRRYFESIKIVLNRAVREGLIKVNPVSMMEPNEKPQGKNAIREFLTLDEIKLLTSTRCRNQIHMQAFLFSCFTGLRRSDIRNLCWDDIHEDTIAIKMQKTGETLYMPMSNNAKAWLPERGSDSRVFRMKSDTILNADIENWVARAGIKKHITFHCARHTFATLTLTYGADLYTISKLLGHRNVQTTQIYAKIVDEKKKEAVNLIPEL